MKHDCSEVAVYHAVYYLWELCKGSEWRRGRGEVREVRLVGRESWVNPPTPPPAHWLLSPMHSSTHAACTGPYCVEDGLREGDCVTHTMYGKSEMSNGVREWWRERERDNILLLIPVEQWHYKNKQTSITLLCHMIGRSVDGLLLGCAGLECVAQELFRLVSLSRHNNQQKQGNNGQPQYFTVIWISIQGVQY